MCVDIWVRYNVKILLELSPLYLPLESGGMRFLVSYEIEIQGSHVFQEQVSGKAFWTKEIGKSGDFRFNEPSLTGYCGPNTVISTCSY